MTVSRLIAVSLIAAFAVIAAAPAEAQSRRELAARIDNLEARLAEMEATSLAGDPVAETLLTRVSGLERELQTLTGRYEELAFENRQLRDELARLRAPSPQSFGAQNAEGVDAGGFALREPGAPAVISGGEADGLVEAGEDGLAIVSEDDPFAEVRAQSVRPLGAAPPPGAEPQFDDAPSGPVALQPAPAPAQTDMLAAPPNPDRAFQLGRNALYDGDFAGAQERFLVFVAEFPDDPRFGEAQYWLGETYFVRGDYADAADAYVESLRAAPRGEKASDSFVRLAASLAELGETGQACQTLEQFNNEYPNANPEARRKARREALRIGCV